ncbi:MAG: hypothetical protein K8T25_01440 [Planctomycetia bacterium]|nr:hypothetical protein [Planctomycetia bacterium]
MPLVNVPQFYAGWHCDAFTGYYNNRARWYDPVSRLFVSRDPIGFSGGDTNTTTARDR